jgi:hypothetical protein
MMCLLHGDFEDENGEVCPICDSYLFEVYF